MKLTAFRAKRIITMTEKRLAAAAATPFSTGASPKYQQFSGFASTPRPVFEDGVIIVQQDTIVAVESYAEFKRRADIPLQDLGDVTLVPGLINCHNHIELSHLGGKTRLGQGFTEWVGHMIRQDMTPDRQAITDAVTFMHSTGTAHVADITSRAPALVAECAAEANLSYHLLLECFGHKFTAPLEDMLWPATAKMLPQEALSHAAPAGHALYSTHPRLLALAKNWCIANGKPYSMHLAEHEGEVQMLADGTGDFKELLSVRVLPPDYTPPRCTPVAHAHALGLLGTGTLAVHCVHCNDDDIAMLSQSGTAVCLCPRSNRAIGTGDAPVHKFMQAGLLLCFGTDSLASNHDLNLWNEARALRDWQGLGPDELLPMLTANGAQALGLTHMGAIAAGMQARWAVLPDDLCPA
ncbi:amidohydrolase family protein [Oleidesulfovibrio sp.]|uniref:amidohydrolase family protein n=1 Tax=Oleidesulfovibrio sp. TaxID=2909707 RepID=UPI003A8C4FB3